jgi:hypothetical protein
LRLTAPNVTPLPTLLLKNNTQISAFAKAIIIHPPVTRRDLTSPPSRTLAACCIADWQSAGVPTASWRNGRLPICATLAEWCALVVVSSYSRQSAGLRL